MTRIWWRTRGWSRWPLAESCGLAGLVADKVSVASPNAWLKVPALVAGMVAGADSIDDMDLLRHGGMSRLFTGIRAPSTLGTFLRSFTFGHVRQLDAVAADMLVALAQRAPLLAAAIDQVCFLDVDDTIRATYGYAKQGAGYGYSKVKGINALIATLSTPDTAPVIAATRLRKGSANSARGAARLVADALVTARRAGVAGLVILRADSAPDDSSGGRPSCSHARAKLSVRSPTLLVTWPCGGWDSGSTGADAGRYGVLDGAR